jgi:hypothetical protein
VLQHRSPAPQTWYVYFGMANPLVGGYTPEQVALRRAIALAYNAPREIELVRKGQMMPAQSVLPPLVSGYDPALKSEMGDHDPPARRPCSTSTASSTATATAGASARRQPAASRIHTPSPTQLSAPAAGAVAQEPGRDRHPRRIQAPPPGRRTSRPAAPAS